MPGLWTFFFGPSIGDAWADVANLVLRVAFGLMVFVIHGVHKAREALHASKSGTPWKLVEEIREMGLPAPRANAIVATGVQLVAPLFVIAGLGTRPAALMLAGALLGAVAQNIKARRDPQLAMLYAVCAVVLGVWGGARYSMDFLIASR